MIQAIRQKIQVKANGRLEILANELQEGMEVEVTVILHNSESDLYQTQLPPPNIAERLRIAAKEYAPQKSSLPPLVLNDSNESSDNKIDQNEHLTDQVIHQEAIDQAQKILSRFIPEGISLVDELIHERRAASELE